MKTVSKQLTLSFAALVQTDFVLRTFMGWGDHGAIELKEIPDNDSKCYAVSSSLSLRCYDVENEVNHHLWIHSLGGPESWRQPKALIYIFVNRSLRQKDDQQCTLKTNCCPKSWLQPNGMVEMNQYLAQNMF